LRYEARLMLYKETGNVCCGSVTYNLNSVCGKCRSFLPFWPWKWTFK